MKPSSLSILFSEEASTKGHVNILHVAQWVLMKVRRAPYYQYYAARQLVTLSINEIYN